MAWSASAMFREFPAMLLRGGSGYDGLDEGDVKVALYDNDITPTKDAALNASGYNVGQWVASGNELTSSTQWPSGGVSLSGQAVTVPSSGVIQFDADDTTHTGTVTISGAYGCLVYDDDVTTTSDVSQADQGISYHYFGGSQSVTTGTFTIVWHSNGLFRITV